VDIGVFQIAADDRADPAIVAAKAEELGFESYWLGDHAIFPVNTDTPYPGGAPGEDTPDVFLQIPDQFMALARASATTKTIKLGTGVCLIAERSPLITAQQVASLDNMSGGRVLFGVGSGWNREECEILGGDYDHRWANVQDNVLAMKQLWTEDKAEYHGKYADFPPVYCYPKPTHKPHPPVLLGGAPTELLTKRTARWGDGWMPIVESPEQFAESGERLAQAAEAVDRDPALFDLTAYGLSGQWRTGDDVRAFEKAGANRLIVWLDSRELDGVVDEMEKLAAEMIG
jgi:probable F420-dependent oxidoreductase